MTPPPPYDLDGRGGGVIILTLLDHTVGLIRLGKSKMLRRSLRHLNKCLIESGIKVTPQDPLKMFNGAAAGGGGETVAMNPLPYPGGASLNPVAPMPVPGNTPNNAGTLITLQHSQIGICKTRTKKWKFFFTVLIMHEMVSHFRIGLLCTFQWPVEKKNIFSIPQAGGYLFKIINSTNA